MEKLNLPPYTLQRTGDGLVATHPSLRTPVPVSEALLLRVVKQAARQALECHGKVQQTAGMKTKRTQPAEA
jgi:hypothetical protein